MRPRPDLIVPIKDRRQHKRYLTLKNAAIACAVAFVGFIAVSIYSEIRRPAANDYGRLARREIPPPPVAQKPMTVVHETPAIDDQAHADPMLVAPAAREQWLGDSTSSAAIIPPPAPVPIARGEGVAIVGGPGGIAIVKQDRRKPQLSGGFGRQ
jgi:hypothetical protein